MKETLLSKIFPNGKSDGRGGREVNGLTANTQPANCVIVKQAPSRFPYGTDRREWYLVEVDGYHVLFRICSAMKGSSYDEFAVAHAFAESSKLEEVQYMDDFFTRQTSDVLDNE